jgi:hypothetical protein
MRIFIWCAFSKLLILFNKTWSTMIRDYGRQIRLANCSMVTSPASRIATQAPSRILLQNQSIGGLASTESDWPCIRLPIYEQALQHEYSIGRHHLQVVLDGLTSRCQVSLQREEHSQNCDDTADIKSEFISRFPDGYKQPT